MTVRNTTKPVFVQGLDATEERWAIGDGLDVCWTTGVSVGAFGRYMPRLVAVEAWPLVPLKLGLPAL